MAPPSAAVDCPSDQAAKKSLCFGGSFGQRGIAQYRDIAELQAGGGRVVFEGHVCARQHTAVGLLSDGSLVDVETAAQ